MSLEDKLAKIREQAKTKIPADSLDIMHRATDDLRASGIMDGVIKVGATLPAFSLNNTAGNIVSSADLLARGPMVLTIFRGHW